LSHDLH
jgi:hypothetical protein